MDHPSFLTTSPSRGSARRPLSSVKKPRARPFVRPPSPVHWSALFIALLVILAIVALPTAGWGLEAGQTKTEHGLTVYLGLLPAEIIRGHPKSHPESTVHGGPPRGEHAYHIVAAIFDAASGARIGDAKVMARVSSLGLAGQRQPLEPMSIADTISYGNYFSLSGKGPYRIDLEIARPQGVVKISFDYRH